MPVRYASVRKEECLAVRNASVRKEEGLPVINTSVREEGLAVRNASV